LTTHDTTLAERVAAIPWYHTFDFPGGLSTQGFFDLRGIPARLPIPPDLTGKRCLDVASADGFFAFEIPNRQASGGKPARHPPIPQPCPSGRRRQR
jgi:hypothetical protein